VNIKKLARRILDDGTPLIPASWTRRGLLLAQMAFGLLWLEGASWKVIVNGELKANYDGLAYWVSRGSEYPVLDAYKTLIDSFILPNIKFFLFFVFATELFIGLLFFVGRYVRLAAIVSVMQTVPIMLSVYNAPHEWKWTYFMMLTLAGVFFVHPTRSSWPDRIGRLLKKSA
jgi:thiosulfate dehydrogenase (quinone) large subunit